MKAKWEPQALCGVLKCGTCGMSITGEYKVKKQKNGNVHEYVYYHCSKRSKTIKCPEPCIRQEVLDKQLSSLLQKFSLRADWAETMLKMLEKDKKNSAQFATAFVKEAETKIQTIKVKLQRLLDGYLEQDIEQQTYRIEKVKLLSEKKSLEEQSINLEQKRTGWLEPMAEWIKEARNLPKIAQEGNLFEKKVAYRTLFGSNLILHNREAAVRPPSDLSFPPENQWAALRAAHELASKKPSCFVVVGSIGFEPMAFSV
ncbi:MAG: recombinase zinc beta ribbon domain-containing protein [Candidatus Magasanikbacteria bacterium]|nr:recombinase zinc beta ribbon domain-containing protein [Candidatus Magasanikbacteria bacterium]